MPMNDDGAIIDALYDALAQGDVAAARSCLTADARIWHSFDQITQSADEAAKGWEQFIGAFAERYVADVRRQATAHGFVQQHLQIAATGSRRMVWPICIVVDIVDGKIAQLAEYMDRAGHFAAPAEEPITTPGLTAAA